MDDAYCDRCPTAKAAYAFTKSTGNDIDLLMLCAHDARQHGAKMTYQGWRMTSLNPVKLQTKAEMDREYTDGLQREWDNR